MVECILTTAQAHETAALQLGIDMKLFDISVATGGPLTVSELAEKASADALLVGQCGHVSFKLRSERC
jgi:hypothetical protein